MPDKYYANDHRLDMLVLGPMGSDGRPSSVVIKEAILEILADERSKALLAATNTLTCDVHVPDSLDGQEIVNEVLTWLDIADLIIVNLTPRKGPTSKSASPNVYYELGLVHALGLPVILLAQAGTEVPFYFRTSRYVQVADFTVPVLVNALRERIHKFLDPDDETDFASNRITQFYGLPIVDISATVGLATGYYYNFVGRLLRDGSFISEHPDKIKHLIVVLPHNMSHTYEQDHQQLVTLLADAGFQLKGEKMDEPAGDKKGGAWMEHVDGIVVDIARTVYPLKNSPRLLALRERLDRRGTRQISRLQRDLMLRQHGENLVQGFQQAIEYHVKKEGDNYRDELLHFASIAQVPALVQRLRATAS